MKKLFAILMSIMMIACFMPTMAFAADGEITTPSVTEPSQNGEGGSQTPISGEAGEGEKATYVAKIGETTYESLAAAIQAIGTNGVEGNRIELVSDTTLDAAITIGKNVTISGKNSSGENYKISGNSDIARSEFIVNEGTLQLEDLTLQNFGDKAATTAGIAVISVPVDAAADVKVVMKGVKALKFNRNVLDIRSGSFQIIDCDFDCAPTVAESVATLTKGILAGLAKNKVVGTVERTTIQNTREANVEGWTSGAIEAKNNAEVTVTDSNISGCKTAFLVTARGRADDAGNNAAQRDAVLTIKGGTYSASSRVLRADARDAFNTTPVNEKDVSIINVESGTFKKTEGSETDSIFSKNGTAAYANINLTGGTFSENPSGYVISGYTTAQNADGSYVVSRVSSGGGSYYPYTPSTPSKPSAPNLDKTKTDSTAAINAAAAANKYDAAEQAEVKKILDKANADIKNAKTEAEVKAIEEAAQAEIDKILTTEEKAIVAALDNVEKRDFATKSKVITRKGGKKVIRLTWTAPDGVDVDGYEIFRSTKKNSGFGKKPYFTTSNTSYTNTKDLKTGKTYYYKVRAFVVINGERVYTDYSMKAFRTIK